MENIGTSVNGFRILRVFTKPRKHPRRENTTYNETWFEVVCEKCGDKKETRAQSLRAGRTGCKQGPCHPKFIDLKDKRFGELTATMFMKTEHKHAPWRWLCLCSCGKSCFIKGSDLQNKTRRCLSCSRKYVGRKNRKSDDHSKWARVRREYKRAASVKGREFKLSLEQVKDICLQPCLYCGDTVSEYLSGINRNGIDRVDSSRGYTIDNCVPCCKTCNFWKRENSQEEFREHIIKLYNNYIIKNVQRPSLRREYTQVSGKGAGPSGS